MFKRMIARLLIVVQVYGCFFQGILHADITQDYLVREEIYLRAMHGKDGTRIALGTNSDIVDEPEILYIIDVPSFESLSKTGPQLGDATLNLSDMFTKKGVTRLAEGVHFTLQGLDVLIDNTGHLLIQGTQTDSKPLFLSAEHPIILKNVRASSLQITAPKIITTGNSAIDYLRFDGQSTIDDESAVFVNAGQLTAKELFLNHLYSENTGDINAECLAVNGRLDSTGSITSGELFLEESAFLRLTETSRTDIKKLFLSEASHLENHATTHTSSIGVWGGLGGSITNHGTLAVSDVAADSAFQAITNRHILDIERGDIKAQNLENSGTFMAAESRLEVASGRNQRKLKAKQLVVEAEFANEASGHMAIDAIAGDGHFHNLGTIKTDTALALGVKHFTTQGRLKATSMTGLDTLISFTNLEAGKVGVLEALGFASTTKVINKGELVAQTMALVSDHTLHSGDLTARELTLTGVAAFANHGTMSVEHLDATTLLLNHGELNTQQSTKFAQGLRVEGKATAQLKGLRVTGGEVTNLGKLRVIGVAPAQDVAIRLINNGTATIDAGHKLPRSSAVIYAKGLAIDPEFDDFTMSMMQRIATHYKSLVKPTDGKTDSEFAEFTMPMMRRAATTYKQQAIASFRLRTLQDLEEQVRAANRQELSEQTLLEKTDQLRAVAERYQVLDAHFKPERDLIEMGMGSIVTSLMRPGLFLDSIRLEQLRKREELKQLTAEKLVLEQELAANSRMVEQRQKIQAQVATYQKLATEIFKVKLEVTNQASGKLTLRSGHFDLTGDQALVNDGLLYQEAAQLHLFDPTTWSAPRSFNTGTWQVKGALTLMGNADKDVGRLEVDSLHVDVPAIGSKVLSGQIETSDFSTSGGIELFGTLTTHKSTHLPQGLTITAGATAELNGLRVGVVPRVETPADSQFTQGLAKARELPGEIDEQQKRIAVLQALDIYPALTQKDYETEHFKRDVLPKLYAKFSHVPYYESYEKYIQSYPRGYPLDIAIRDAIEQSGKVFETFMHQGIRVGQGIPFTMHSETERRALVSELRERQGKLEELQRQKIELLSDRVLRVGDEIINVGTLRIIGVDPNSGIIKLINGGTAVIDAGYTLPRLDEHSPENLARVATSVGPVSWDSSSLLPGVDHEFAPSHISPLTVKSSGLKYLKLLKALQTREDYVADPQTDPTLASANGLRLKQLATQHKRAFIKLYESEVVKSRSEGSAAEQAELQEYLKQFAPYYQQVITSRKSYARTLYPAVGAALVVENEQIPAVKLQLLNQEDRQLTLKSGKFEFVGDSALVNYGTLTQTNAYTLWLTSAPGDFNRGTWRANGSLILFGNDGSNMGELQVEESLHVKTTQDALITLDALTKVKARKVFLQAPSIENSLLTHERKPKQYPWLLDLQITGSVQNAFDISVPGLKFACQSLKTTGNIFVHPGMLELAVEGEVDIKAAIYARAGINLHSKKLGIQARLNIPGAATPSILYKRAELGLYSEGPVVLDIDELIGNYYGDIQGTSLTITAPQLINTAGLICATDSSLSSILSIKNIKNTRDDYASRPEGFSHYNYPYHEYQYETGGVYYREWCSAPCCPLGGCSDGKCLAVPVYRSTGYYETSDEGVIVSEGDLTLDYNTLEMIVSSITSRGNLTLVSSGHSLDYPNLAVGAELLALPGTTTMAKRNGHVNRIVAKKGLVANVGRADIAASMYGQNVAVRAAVLTMQSLGFASQQQAQVFDLFTQAQSSTNAYRRIEDGSRGYSIDTLAPYSEQLPPDSIVVLGRDAQAQMERSDRINLRMYKRAIKQQIQRLFFSYGRGIDGLGVSLSDFFKLNSAFVRSHPDTRSQTHSIRFGDQTHEVELLLNPTLTPQTVLERQDRVLHLQIDQALDTFEENLNALQSEDLVSDALARARQRSKMLQGSIKLAIQPELQSDRCIRAADTASLVSETDASIATSVKALNIQIIANGTTTVSSDVIHYQYGEYGQNYWQALDRTSIEAVKTLLIEGKNIHFKAINTHSGKETRFISRGNTVDETVALASQRFSDIEDGWSRDRSVHQAVSTHSSGGSITSLALGEQHLFAPSFDCKKLVIEGLEGVSIYGVHDTHEHESHTSKSGGGLLGGTTETHTSSHSARSKGARLTASDSVEILSGGDINLRNVSLFTPHTSLESLEGVVSVLLGTNYYAYSRVESSEDMFLQSFEATLSKHSTFTTPTVTGEVVINSQRKAIVQKIHQQALSYTNQIKIEGGGRIVFENVYEHHEHFHVEQSGPTAAFAAVVAIGVSIATAGTGAGPALASSAVSAVGATGVTAAVISGMTVGAFTAVCNQAAMALLYSKGDIGKAAKILASSQSLKEIGFGAISGGLVGNGVSGTSLASFGGRVIQSTVNAGLRKAIMNEDFERAATQGVMTAGIDTLAANAATKIGDLHHQRSIDPFTQHALHFVQGSAAGALSGIVTGQDVQRSALSRGFGSALGEGLGEITGSKPVADFMATVAGAVVGLDPVGAYQGASITTQYNCFGVHEASMAFQVYDDEDIKEGAEIVTEAVAECVNETLEEGRSVAHQYWDRLARIEQSQGWSSYSGPGIDGMEYTTGSSTFRAGTDMLVDSLRVPENPALAALHIATFVPGAGKVIAEGVQCALRFGERAVGWAAPRVSSAFGTAARATGDVGSHIRLPTTGTAANRNFIQSLNSNRNVMPARATGTHGLPSGITPSQAPTLGGVPERYGASTSAHRSVMASDLRAGGHGAPHQGTSHLGSISEHQASHASATPKTGDVGFAPKDISAHELYKRELRVKMERPHAENQKLDEILKRYHKDHSTVDSGSTAAALRKELATGQPVGGKFHTQKVEQGIVELGDWLKQNPLASAGNRAAAENMLRDLLDAAKGLPK